MTRRYKSVRKMVLSKTLQAKNHANTNSRRQAQSLRLAGDKFGVTWHIVPKQLRSLVSDPDRAKAVRVMQAMMQMSKVDIAQLQRVADAPSRCALIKQSVVIYYANHSRSSVMPLNELRFIVAVAQQLNFRRAAEQCFISQPAL